MKGKLVNSVILLFFLALVRLSDVGVEGAKEQIIRKYINAHPEYRQVLQSIEYREKNLKPEQKEIFISGGKEIDGKLFDLKMVEWSVAALLILAFSFAFGRANRSSK